MPQPPVLRPGRQTALVLTCAGWLTGLLSGCIVIPPPVASHFNRGVEFQDQGKNSDAIEEYQLALRERPDDTFAKYNLAVVFQDMAQDAEAEKLYGEILAVTEDTHSRINRAAIYHARGEKDRALEELRTAAEKNPYNPNPLSVLGDYLEQENKLKEAEDHYQQAVAIDGKHAASWHRLGRVQVKRGEARPGLLSLARAVELDPEDPAYLVSLAEAHEREHRVLEAINLYEQASVLDPDRVDLYVKLGDLYSQKEMFSEAVNRYWSALSIKGDDPHVHRRLRDIFELLARQESVTLKELEKQSSFAQNP